MERTLLIKDDNEFFALRQALEARDAYLEKQQKLSQASDMWDAIYNERRRIMHLLSRLEKTLVR